jgi:gas vesicle protein
LEFTQQINRRRKSNEICNRFVGLATLLGGLIGANVALLFAPPTGEGLPTNIKTEADAEYVKLQED